MFEELKTRLSLFISDRNWFLFHHPKNLVMALMREIAELSEHFIANPVDKERQKFIKEELGDVFNTLILFAKTLNIDLEEPKEITYKHNLNIAHLVFLGGTILEHFLWKSDEENKQIVVTDSLKQTIFNFYDFLLAFADMLEMNIMECGLEKLCKAEKKYPIERVSGSLKGYFACKNQEINQAKT